MNVILALTLILGWVLNLVQIIYLASHTLTLYIVFKAIGVIVPPLGVILGFVGLF